MSATSLLETKSPSHASTPIFCFHTYHDFAASFSGNLKSLWLKRRPIASWVVVIDVAKYGFLIADGFARASRVAAADVGRLTAAVSVTALFLLMNIGISWRLTWWCLFTIVATSPIFRSSSCFCCSIVLRSHYWCAVSRSLLFFILRAINSRCLKMLLVATAVATRFKLLGLFSILLCAMLHHAVSTPANSFGSWPCQSQVAWSRHVMYSCARYTDNVLWSTTFVNKTTYFLRTASNVVLTFRTSTKALFLAPYCQDRLSSLMCCYE